MRFRSTIVHVLGWLAVVAAPAAAQLPDLQPGRNFPTADAAFGTGRSEQIDVGDVDNDGDLDVAVANGGDGSPQVNLIYINQGGLQGGSEGAFVDESATRFAGLPADTSRDVEFADFDGDGDLDIAIANRGTTANGGEVSRAYVNQGGRQLGAVGFFEEGTDAFWGTLVSVPPEDEEGVQDGQGPWRGYLRDLSFADFDDDGDLDLAAFGAGVNFNGNEFERLFLNDGDGRFDELFPWADASADIKLHCNDVDLADFDGDLDIDIFASSRNSQSRIYRNNLAETVWSGDPFTDVTQSALLDTGAAQGSFNTYAMDYGDLDGDGDFDAWMNNYAGGSGLLERVLRNDGNLEFHVVHTWIQGDTNTDEEDVTFLDYDGDGDLDAFLPTFSGTNSLYLNGLEQGVDPGVDGLYHRTGTSAGGSLAPDPETPESGNGGTTLDGQGADLDGDGDPDIVLANDANQDNRLWINVLGVPDTHAPTIQQMDVQGDKADGSDTVIHAAVRDNAGFQVVAFYDARLVYSVDGGPKVCQKMFAQGGQQFRGVIPGGLDGEISYRVDVTDDAGNTGVSTTVTYLQSSSGVVAWQQLDCGTPGIHGRPYLTGSGDLTAGSPVVLNLTDAAPNALAGLFLSASSTPVPFKGGTLYAFPFGALLFLPTDDAGQIWAPLTWPAGIPSQTSVWFQYAVQDAAALGGVSVSNAVKATTP